MPSGPPELHEKWKSDGNACEFLESKGFRLGRNFNWYGKLPSKDDPDYAEIAEAIYYLIAEWDYGGYSGSLCEAKMMGVRLQRKMGG